MNTFLTTWAVGLLLAVHASEPPSSRHFWHSVETSAPSGVIWGIWTDVVHWHLWDTGLQSAALDGPFQLDQTGTLVSDKGRKVKFRVSEYDPSNSYAIQMKLPLGRFTIRRTLSSEAGRTVFTHDVEFSGFSAGLFGRWLGRDYKQQLPGAMENIRALAEKKQG